MKLKILSVFAMALFLTVFPAFAAQNAPITNININAAGCYMDVTFQVEDAGSYYLNVYDDGDLIAGAGRDFADNEIVTVRVTMGILVGVTPGIVVSTRDGLGSPTVYEFALTGWTDAEGIDCDARGFSVGAFIVSDIVPEATASCPNPTPADAVVRSVPAGAAAYFAQDLGAHAGFELPAGTWYVSPREGDFSMVWIACQAAPIYILDSAVAS